MATDVVLLEVVLLELEFAVFGLFWLGLLLLSFICMAPRARNEHS